MKTTSIIFIFSLTLMVSCSTAYKSGQTPDDLYYSKGKIKAEAFTRYERREEVPEDRTIRMAARDARWRTLDDRYGYSTYSPYHYGYGYGYYFNPYYYPYPVYNPNIKFVNPTNTTIRSTNLAAYNQNVRTYTPTKGSGYTRTEIIRGYNKNNSDQTRYNNSETRIYNSPSTNNSNSNSSYNNSNNAGSNNSGSPVTRPVRN